MKTIRIFSLLLCGALFVFAACEGGFVEPSGKLIVENQSESSTITSVETDMGSAWLKHWKGNAGPGDKITLQIDPGKYTMHVKDSKEQLSNSLIITVMENEEKHIIFNGTAISEPHNSVSSVVFSSYSKSE
jgi:uncharacterized protein YqkB